MIEIRPFQVEDWGWDVLLELADRAVPFAPDGNAEWLEYRKAFDESKRVRVHYIAVYGEDPVGYGCLEQQSDDPQWLRIFVVCSPENLNGEVGDRLYGKLLQDAGELGSEHFWAREYQEDEPAREFFAGRGFVEVKRFIPPGELPMVVYVLDLEG